MVDAALGEPGVEGEQRVGRRAVGAVDQEGPVKAAADTYQPVTMGSEQAFVFAAVQFGPVKDVRTAGFGIAELDSAGEWKGLLYRIDDLQQMGTCPAAGDRLEGLFDFVEWIEEIADHDKIGKSTQIARVGCGAASIQLRKVFSNALGAVAGQYRVADTKQADPLAGLGKQLGEGKEDDDRSVSLGDWRQP